MCDISDTASETVRYQCINDFAEKLAAELVEDSILEASLVYQKDETYSGEGNVPEIKESCNSFADHQKKGLLFDGIKNAIDNIDFLPFAILKVLEWLYVYHD
ncbi:hypothetical protein COOONC_02105 [Cooperia oncophora]